MSALNPAVEDAVATALSALDLPTKVRLLSGMDTWSLPPVPEIGLRPVVMSDGPVGVRGYGWLPDDPAVALPSPTALAATWDVALARTAGRLLGQEARRKGVDILLAPTVNLHRSPLGGRHFEAYSEDPLLSAELGAAYVTGVQEHAVATTVKHYVANDFETERLTVDVHVAERALRELYLAPFETIVARGGWGVMAAYNSVNGATMTEHAELLNGVLKDEWGFDGVVVSDWTAARSTAETALGGLDVVMPAFASPWGDELVEAVRSGEVPEDVIDEHVRRVLRLAARVGALDGVPPAVPPQRRPAPLDGDALAREVAVRSTVLARNAGDLLPLDPAGLRRVALLGALAHDARVLGGGSAQVFPAHVVSPLEGLSTALPDGVELTYAVGADPRVRLATANGPQWIGGTGDASFTAVFRDQQGALLREMPLPTASARWFGEMPEGVDIERLATVELTVRFTPRETGTHGFGISGVGEFTFAVDGRAVHSGNLGLGTDDLAFALLAPPEQRVPVELTAGQSVALSLTHTPLKSFLVPVVAFGLGHTGPTPVPDALIEEAVRVAADADVAVVVVGTTDEVESEGFDRTSVDLPGRQDELVHRVAAVNPRTIVVINAGSPVLMPWLDEVAAVLLTWFGGQQAGAALAEVLLGTAEPGGRLPTTWPRRAEDCPVFDTTPHNGQINYDEGVFIGYRGWQRSGRVPLFEFGSGHGYTTWEYQDLTVVPGDGLGTATIRVRNTGSRPGREVVQVYLAPEVPDPRRPERWLAGFAVAEAAPGQTATVTVDLPTRAAQIWDAGWHTVPGRYQVAAAHSLTDPRATTTIKVPPPEHPPTSHVTALGAACPARGSSP